MSIPVAAAALNRNGGSGKAGAAAAAGNHHHVGLRRRCRYRCPRDRWSRLRNWCRVAGDKHRPKPLRILTPTIIVAGAERSMPVDIEGFGIAGAVDFLDVAAAAAEHVVLAVADTVDDGVVAAVAFDIVVAAAAADGVRAGAAKDQVIAAPAAMSSAPSLPSMLSSPRPPAWCRRRRRQILSSPRPPSILSSPLARDRSLPSPP